MKGELPKNKFSVFFHGLTDAFAFILQLALIACRHGTFQNRV
jgi:hypothetical protein